jgi:NADPH-dependent ferric siderophore reductase
MAIIEALMKRLLNKATVVHKAPLTREVYHIKIQSESIKEATFLPGYFLRVGVGIDIDGLSTKDKIRSYSVWNLDKAKGIIDLAVATESKGPGAEWAKNCKVNDTLYFAWHKGKFIVDDSADSYLMIGDLSALAHLYCINDHLSGKQVESIIYSQDKNDLFANLDGSKPFNFYQLPQNPTAELIAQIQEVLPKMNGNKQVYIGGDSRVCVALTQYFRNELGWSKDQLKVKPFWNPEKKGLE